VRLCVCLLKQNWVTWQTEGLLLVAVTLFSFSYGNHSSIDDIQLGQKNIVIPIKCIKCVSGIETWSESIILGGKGVWYFVIVLTEIHS
jgi:hypothetical protein